MSCLVLELRGALGPEATRTRHLDGTDSPREAPVHPALKGWGEVWGREDEVQRTEHSGVRRRREPFLGSGRAKGKCQ